MRDIRELIAELAITHPDPDDYDRGFNDAIRRALDAIATDDAEPTRPKVIAASEDLHPDPHAPLGHDFGCECAGLPNPFPHQDHLPFAKGIRSPRK